MSLNLKQIDKTWTLFLDRDGVINHEKHNDYIHIWEEFIFYEGVKQAITIFSQIFCRVIVITNQRGIGKGVTTLDNLNLIHQNMAAEIKQAGGKIDAVYFCPDVDNNSLNRKPNTGMGLQAQKDFEEIDFSKTIMVGNTLSDMKFGKNLGAYTIFLPTTRPEVDTKDILIDAVYPSLISVALDL
jgi:D-glycero-D-manno-heptose 1,7-bisphosphate phosphatase